MLILLWLTGAIIGPYRAVRPWAKDRFTLIPSYLKMIQRKPEFRGWGIQSEQFLAETILPAMERQPDIIIREDPTMCFLRVRPNENVWYNEGCKAINLFAVVPALLNRPCYLQEPGAHARDRTFNHHCPSVNSTIVQQEKQPTGKHQSTLGKE